MNTAGDNNICHASFSLTPRYDIFPPLSAGACIHVVPSEMRQDTVTLYDCTNQNRITGALSTQFGLELINQFELPTNTRWWAGRKCSC